MEFNSLELTLDFKLIAVAASQSGSHRSVRHLLDHPDTDPNFSDLHGWTALHTAANEGKPRYARIQTVLIMLV